MKKRVLIIGAGPAGLMAADYLSARGVAVAVYERMPSAARKFLMAGRGGLNITHSEHKDLFLARYREAETWLAPMIEAFSPQDTWRFAEGLGEELFIGSSGRVFPKTMKASTLLRAWLRRLAEQGVTFHFRHTMIDVATGYAVFETSEGTSREDADAVILALGGASWPKLGSKADWVEMLCGKGVEIAPFVAANSGFAHVWSDRFKGQFAGAPLKGIRITLGNESRKGEGVITKHGVEGGVFYALSAPIRKAIETQGQAQVVVDLTPDVSAPQWQQRFAKPRARLSFSNWARKCGLSALHLHLLYDIHGVEKVQAMDAALLAESIKALPITLTQTAGLERAISSAGGVVRNAVDDGLMLCALPHVYAAGEMLDWEAPTGGYLLQACFATGLWAAKACLAQLERDGE